MGDSNPSNEIQFTTLPGAPVLSLTDCTNSYCSLSWTNPGGIVDSYCIYKNNVIVQSGIVSNSAVINNLVTGDVCDFYVVAVNNTGQSDPSNMISITVPYPLTAPTNPLIHYWPGPGYVLTWTPSTTPCSGYQLIEHIPFAGIIGTTTSNGYCLSCNVTLKINTVYVITIAPYNEYGHIGSSVTTGFYTSSDLKSQEIFTDSSFDELKALYNIEGEIKQIPIERYEENPEINIFAYSHDDLKAKRAKIYDLSGRLVLDFSYQNPSTLSELNRGTYILQMEQYGRQSTSKFQIFKF